MIAAAVSIVAAVGSIGFLHVTQTARADELTERECNVVRFTCPYGFGPAGEPCDCTDPRGVVLRGKTVK
jgi:hypothetical protein